MVIQNKSVKVQNRAARFELAILENRAVSFPVMLMSSVITSA